MHGSHTNPAPCPHVLLADSTQSILDPGGTNMVSRGLINGERDVQGFTFPQLSQAIPFTAVPYTMVLVQDIRTGAPPRTPLLCISSQKPSLPNKNRAGNPGSKLSRPSALLPTPNQASRTPSFLEFSGQLPTRLLSLPTAYACNAWKERDKFAAPEN